MSLVFLIMDDGGWVSGSKSVRISTNNFTLPLGRLPEAEARSLTLKLILKL
jgi:hypothetical protein